MADSTAGIPIPADWTYLFDLVAARRVALGKPPLQFPHARRLIFVASAAGAVFLTKDPTDNPPGIEVSADDINPTIFESGSRLNNESLRTYYAKGLLPNLKGLPDVDPRLTMRIEESFRQLYEIINYRFNLLQAALQKYTDTKVANQANELSSLIGNLSQPLIGSDSVDPVLQSVASFPIKQTDLPTDLIATKLNADGTILDVNSILDGEYLRRTGNTIVSGTPVGTTTLVEATLPIAEEVLYTTPVGHRTKIRHVLLFNNSAGALDADVLAKDPANNPIYNDNENLASLQKVILTPNIILPANYTFRGFTSAVGAIEFTIFGIEEPL